MEDVVAKCDALTWSLEPVGVDGVTQSPATEEALSLLPQAQFAKLGKGASLRVIENTDETETWG